MTQSLIPGTLKASDVLDTAAGGKPQGFGAVMAHRVSAPDDLDYFPTPPWAARAGGELIKRLDPFAFTCWEPACGEGHMAWGLKDYFDNVGSSDVFAYGHGSEFDFLDPALFPDERTRPSWDWIVTNPPFVKGEAFVRAAWPRAKRGVAMLLRLQFREGVGRASGLFSDHPLAAKATFAERAPMVKGRWDPEASSATAYAWFLWLKPEALATSPARAAIEAAQAFDRTAGLDLLIEPGTRERLTEAADFERFGLMAAAPLFEPST